jgi:hypothetical protein
LERMTPGEGVIQTVEAPIERSKALLELFNTSTKEAPGALALYMISLMTTLPAGRMAGPV